MSYILSLNTKVGHHTCASSFVIVGWNVLTIPTKLKLRLFISMASSQCSMGELMATYFDVLKLLNVTLLIPNHYNHMGRVLHFLVAKVPYNCNKFKKPKLPSAETWGKKKT